MARKRLEDTIDLTRLAALGQYHSTIKDAAHELGMAPETLGRLLKRSPKCADAWEGGHAHYRNALRKKMLDKALEGDNTQLVWVSKNTLGWSDKQEVHVLTAQERFDTLIRDEEVMAIVKHILEGDKE